MPTYSEAVFPFPHSTFACDFDKQSEAEGMSGNFWAMLLKRPAASTLMLGSSELMCKKFKYPEADFCRKAHRSTMKSLLLKVQAAQESVTALALSCSGPMLLKSL